MTGMTTNLLNAHEVADLAGVSTRTVNYAVRVGDLFPAMRLGRGQADLFSTEETARWIQWRKDLGRDKR